VPLPGTPSIVVPRERRVKPGSRSGSVGRDALLETARDCVDPSKSGRDPVITKTSEYALRAVVLLTENEGARLTLQVIARHTQVPSSYLSKVLQGLVHHGVVTSVRGPAGGFALARPPSCITVYDVVQAVDPIPRITSCPLDLPEHARALCPLHRKLDQAAALLEKSFRATPLTQLREHASLSERED